MASNEVDVVVVGAGLSGLIAATEVQRAGLSCVVLEAMDRVGGKTLTIPASSQGGLAELGAAWLNDTNQFYMYALAKKFGFELEVQRHKGLNLFEDSKGKTHSVEYGNEYLNEYAKQAELTQLVHPELSQNARKHDNMTFADFAKQFSPDAELIADDIAETLLGVEAKDISALYMFNYTKSGTGLDNILSDLKDGGQYMRNRHGNQNFSVRLADDLKPETVHLSSPVTNIKQRGQDSCIITTLTGRQISCKKVIISIPTSLYHRIEFIPSLPETKKDLSSSTRLGFYAKVIAVYEYPWWRQAGLSGIFSSVNGPICCSRDTCIVGDHQYSITCMVTGESGKDWSRLPPIEKHKLTMKQFNAAFSTQVKHIPDPLNVIVHDWSEEPWILGAPSPVMPPGLMTSDAGKSLREPFKNIHFVGTETAIIWKGYMEGAVRAGIRGAGEVIELLVPETERRAFKSFL
ncbi:amine oxidase [Aspergillus steynii IBT 23096]|uniref:Amine oxidase n=1 Tax=Aspergillus steynii IBT 23096 TaxID=1392250 RepID=A0A2I2G0N7_9EURO|nr:amine oxidase [Aspergillus steynii IBT 23096]PLB46406.1 amine oxidase [Aspergillus steynii IBT 23096]